MQVVNPRHQTPQGQVWDSRIEYPSWESKHDTSKSEGDMYNQRSKIQKECPGTETFREVRVCGIKTT